MFIGHFGVGFGAKAVRPAVSLGTLFLASQFIDLLWPTLLLLGLERVAIAPGITATTPLDFVHYPISHSLLMVCVWAVVVGGTYWLVRRRRLAALLVGLCVVSHWVLDLAVHRPDLPLGLGPTEYVGLGLWHSVAATLAVEGLLFAMGVFLYVRTSRANDRVGSYGLVGLIGFLILIYAGNISGSPPPSERAIAWLGQAQWLLVAWGYWVDRHRVVRTEEH